jgi:hypothetical protein
MFGARSKAGWWRRGLAVPAGVMSVVLVVGVVQAVASGPAPASGTAPVTPPPPPPSPQHGSAALAPPPATTGSSTATAVTADGQASPVSCGQTITASTTLTANLSCANGSNGIVIGANSVVLNLNGHLISGSGGVGVSTNFASDTIENGYVLGFSFDVGVSGSSDVVTAMQTAGAGSYGVLFFAVAKKGQVTNSTSEQNGIDGVADLGVSDIVKADHLLNNSQYGLQEGGSGALVTGNVANGNGIGQATDGIAVTGTFPVNTVTGNVANDNGAFGINAPSPSIDGGGNKAQGNTNQAQCLGIACS